MDNIMIWISEQHPHIGTSDDVMIISYNNSVCYIMFDKVMVVCYLTYSDRQKKVSIKSY
jgi:hypothetical protein